MRLSSRGEEPPHTKPHNFKRCQSVCNHHLIGLEGIGRILSLAQSAKAHSIMESIKIAGIGLCGARRGILAHEPIAYMQWLYKPIIHRVFPHWQSSRSKLSYSMRMNSSLVPCKPIEQLPPTANEKQTFLLAAQGQMETERSKTLTERLSPTASELPERVKNILLAQPLNPLVKLAFSIVRNGPKAPASQPA